VVSLRTLTVIAFTAGIGIIALGFYWLARGSLTLAPVLLVGGYCVVIPVAIMIGRPRAKQAGPDGGERANSSAG